MVIFLQSLITNSDIKSTLEKIIFNQMKIFGNMKKTISFQIRILGYIYFKHFFKWYLQQFFSFN